MSLKTNKNNIDIKGELTIKTSAKKLDKALIRVMLETIVPLGYSYHCNDEMNKGVIRFNKNVNKGVSKESLEEKVFNVLLEHPRVVEFKVIYSKLCPVEMFEMKYHCPVPFVNQDILLDS